MKLAIAQGLANEIVDLLRPHCGRIEIAGGVRRSKPEPHDIEIVARPTSEPIFGYLNSVDQGMHQLVDSGKIQLGDPFTQHKGEKEIVCKAPFSEKYYRVKYKGEKVDVFVVTPPASWGVEFLLRTGDGGHNIWIVTKGYPRGIYFMHGRLMKHVDAQGRYISESQSKWRKGEHKCDLKACGFIDLPTPEEENVFEALLLPYEKPEDRVVWQPATIQQWEEATLA